MQKETVLSRELLDLVSVAKRLVRQEFKSESGAGLPTLTQFRILHRIKNGVQHVGQLAEAFGISQPATSIMVNTLVQEGLLKRVPHPTDRRQIELHLTTKANAHLETGYRRAFATIDGKLSSLSAAKKKAIAKQLRELTDLLAMAEG
jgi:DNA-binding MarR family transcriptional regulator